MLIRLLSFWGSLAANCLWLNNETCITSPTLLVLNPVEFSYYPFMISLDKCNGSCNAVDDLSTKECVPSQTKDINVKVFNMLTRVNEAEVKHVLCECKSKFGSTVCNSQQKWNDNKWHC